MKLRLTATFFNWLNMNRKQRKIEKAIDEVMPVAEKIGITREELKIMFLDIIKSGCSDINLIKKSLKEIVNNLNKSTE